MSERKKGQHHGDLRGALIGAALDLLEQAPLAEISLRAIARRAGVSAAAPYHHFGDKEGVWAAIAEEGFLSLHAALEETTAGACDPRERLRGMCATYVRFAVLHGAHYRLMFEPALDDPDRFFELKAAALRAFEELAGAIAAATGLEDQRLRERTVMVWAFCHGAAQLQSDGMLGPLGAMSPELDDVARRVAAHGVALALVEVGDGPC